MSVTAFDQNYIPQPGERPIYARPLGSIAATMIGAVALVVLGASLLFVGKRPAVEKLAAVEPRPLPVPTAYTPAPALDAAGSIGGTVKQYANFDLSAPEFAREKKVYATRQLDQGAGREDSLTLGQFAQGGPFMRLDIRQTAGEKLGNSDFFLDITQHATQSGLSVPRIGQPGPLASRFGAFEAADIRLSQLAADGPASERGCLAMRLIDARLSLEIAGFACGSAAKPIDRSAMGCIIDRLDYLSNGVNKALDQFFLNAELERGKGCAGVGAMTPTATKAASKSSWLDPQAITPALKSWPLALKSKSPAPVKRKKKAH
jgi:hypothetical protein